MDHFVHQAVGFGLLGGHEVVAVAILLDLFDGAAGVLGDDGVEPLFELEHVFDPDLHVAGGAFSAAEHLVNHDIRIRQRITFAFCARAQENRAHACRLADAIGIHVACHELHRVIDRESGCDTPARRINIKMNILYV